MASKRSTPVLRQLAVAIIVLLVAACSGGGCSSGCGGCGVTPLPGGYPKAQTLDNAASVRLTRAGLDFIGDNLGDVAGKILMGQNGTLSFNIPTAQSSSNLGLGITADLKICPNGPKPNAMPPECVAEVDLAKAKLHVDAATYAAAGNKPALRVSGTIPLRVQHLPVNVGGTFSLGDFGIGVGQEGNPACKNGVPNGPNGLGFDYFNFPIEILLPLVAETVSPRDGYMKVDTKNAVINPTINNNNIALCKDCGPFSAVCNGLIGFIKGLVFNSIKNPLINQIKSLLDEQLCTKPNPNVNPQCPTNSQPMGGKCVYTSDPTTCVPMMLGLDGHMDLSSALKSISPSTSGGLDFVLAAGGNMNPAPNAGPDNQGWPGHTPNGATLGFLGGVTAMPPSGCVPFADVKPPTGIPVPDEMLSNTITPWPMNTAGPHVGIALAGRFLDFAMAGVYNSGLLCLGVTTEQVTMLSSGLVSVIIPSLKKLTFEQKPTAVAISTRPQSPPRIKLGGGTDIKADPLMKVQLDQFAVDFYVWSHDRFIRVMTFTADVGVPVNLSTAKDPMKNPTGGLLPSLGDLDVKNPKVTNAELLTDDPNLIATSLGGLIGGLAGQFLGGINPVDLSGSLANFGLGLTIPDGGIRKLTKGSDDFLAIFANLAKSGGMATLELDVQAKLVDKSVDPSAMGLSTMSRERAPSLRVLASSSLDDGSRAIEYSWKIDQGTRSEWKLGRDITVKSDGLFLQGKHVLSVYAREKGHPESESTTPALVPFTIDVLAPVVDLDDDGAVHAFDYVSPESALVARFKQGSGGFGPWVPLAELAIPRSAKDVTVEVKDEEGNVGSVSSAIRGRGDSTIPSGGGCSCSSASQKTTLSLDWLVCAGAFVAVWRKLRRKGVAPRPLAGSRRVPRSFKALISMAVLAAANPGCDCGGDKNAGKTGCGMDCNQPCGEALPVGLIGAYTSVATAPDGTVWVAGYNDAVLSNGLNALYGDLVVGKWDKGKQAVDWRTVDGLPPARTDGTCPENDPRGWRKGEQESGPNVGLWTSMQLEPASKLPMIAYYDATNAALKFALYDGVGAAASYTLQQKPGADIGRYVKMILVNGSPVLAYLHTEKGNAGKTRSKIVVARATKSPPLSNDWTFEDAAVDEEAPCNPAFCGVGEACIKSTGACTPTVGGCQPDCGMGKSCVTVMNKATCENSTTKDSPLAYPNANGLYVSLAQGPQGLGVVAYDRVRGNLMGISNAGGKWTSQILDGQTGANNDPMRVDTGDVGIGASLFIAPNGDWHIAYVNGIRERLQYLLVPGGGKPLAPEIIDDGTNSGAPYPDGKHVVGDDATLQVDPNSGTVVVAYQDSTSGLLRVAKGTLMTGGAHKWTANTIVQANKFAGFFPRLVDATSVTNFYRQTNRQTQEMFGDVSIVNF